MAHLRMILAVARRLQTLGLSLHRIVQVLAIMLASAIAIAAQDTPAEASSQDGGFFSMLFSGYGISVLLVLILIGLIIARKIRAGREGWENVEEQPKKNFTRPKNEPATGPRNQMRRAEDQLEMSSKPTVEHWENPVQTNLDSGFGAYRVDQEVWKLIFGKPHRMDVLASRAHDDRRAIEASLVKALTAFDTDEDGRRRAREALEEYGFVARESAVLLLGRDAWERSSAARTLGQIGSPSSVPFLIEALHDTDVVVRNQAVSSLGLLKLPAAIGALLDIAKRHPDIPAPLLSEALSACSVETPSFLELSSTEPDLVTQADILAEPVKVDAFDAFINLPEGDEDAGLNDALDQLKSDDEQVRVQAARLLGSYHVQRSVAALSTSAMSDNESSVRAAAVASLGSIDHESVFAPVLIALSDESRGVQAAAARALTSLRFDRGDAYVRVIETADQRTLKAVARGCLKIGVVPQAIDRLASEDRRQAYEAFSLFTLLAKAGEADPVIQVIETHPDENVRLTAVRVLSGAAQPELAPRLRDLVASEKISENLRTAILEVLYKLDQEMPAAVSESGDNVTTDVA